MRNEIPEIRYAPGRGQTDDVEGFLDRHRNPQKRPALSAGEGSVGGPRRFAAPLEIAHDDRIKLAVERLNACDDVIGQLERGNTTRGKRGDELFGRGVVQQIVAEALTVHSPASSHAFSLCGPTISAASHTRQPPLACVKTARKSAAARPASGKRRDRGRDVYASSTLRTAAASCSLVRGFWIKATPGSRRP